MEGGLQYSATPQCLEPAASSTLCPGNSNLTLFLIIPERPQGSRSGGYLTLASGSLQSYNCVTREVPILSGFAACERGKSKYLPSKQGVSNRRTHFPGKRKLSIRCQKAPHLSCDPLLRRSSMKRSRSASVILYPARPPKSIASSSLFRIQRLTVSRLTPNWSATSSTVSNLSFGMLALFQTQIAQISL